MARKKHSVVIPDDANNRDQGKIFVLTEVSAYQAERWGNRAYLAMARAGVEVPPEFASMGVAGLYLVGLRALSMSSWSDVEPLLEEMLACISILSPRGDERPLMLNIDIEEVSTLHRLRREIIELHLGFTIAEGLSRLAGTLPTASGAKPSTSQS